MITSEYNLSNNSSVYQKESESDQTIQKSLINDYKNIEDSNEHLIIPTYFEQTEIKNCKLPEIRKLSNCKYCHEIKPLRAHHCSICNICVLKMDHHCPWINNCVGQNNHRYFVLFLTHTLFGCLFVLFIGIPIIFNSSIKKSQEYNFIFILCFAGTFLLLFFNMWNWFLIFRGYTTIEFWSDNTFLNKEKLNLNQYFFYNWKENLLVVFGTKSLINAIFLPSIKKLPISGLEWTKIVYPSFRMEFNDLDDEQDLKILKQEGDEDINNCGFNEIVSNMTDNNDNKNNRRDKYLNLV